MKYPLAQTTETFSSAYTAYGDPINIAAIGGDSISLTANIDVDTPNAVVVASGSIDFSTETWTSAAHGFSTGLKVQLTTSHTLPAPLATSTDYFVIVLTANTFQLASSLALAQAGTPINLTNAGTGNQTVTPVALAGGGIKFQQTNADPDLGLWSDIGSATSVAADGVYYVEKDRPTSRWVRYGITLTAGHISATLYTLVKGDKA